MRKVLILVFGFVLSSNLIAQKKEPYYGCSGEDYWVNTDSLRAKLFSDLEFPSSLPDDSIHGKMIVSFTILENGKTSSCKVVKGISHYVDSVLLCKLRMTVLKRGVVFEYNKNVHDLSFSLPIQIKSDMVRRLKSR